MSVSDRGIGCRWVLCGMRVGIFPVVVPLVLCSVHRAYASGCQCMKVFAGFGAPKCIRISRPTSASHTSYFMTGLYACSLRYIILSGQNLISGSPIAFVILGFLLCYRFKFL